jgi:hypothetical protein
MPVATLIVIRPTIEVKAIEGDSLNANRNARKQRTDFAIEAIPVHPEVGGRVTHPNKPGSDRSAPLTPRFQDWRCLHRLEAHRRPRESAGGNMSGGLRVFRRLYLSRKTSERMASALAAAQPLF